MPVYVDNLATYSNGTGYWRNRPSCHLIADSIKELIEFAESIGIDKERFQPKSSPHFDLTAESRAAAVANGAIELGRREFVAKLREIRRKGESGGK